jgi:hypothetical protein
LIFQNGYRSVIASYKRRSLSCDLGWSCT